MTSNDKKQVLLCGTQYGQTYLPAISQSKGLELAGILAKGSDRSIRFAEQHGVNLYTHLEQINQPVDIACVALNEHVATPIANTFLKQGIDVLVEHPMGIDNIKTLITSAQQHDSTCHINGHFANLPPIADFIRLCQKLNQGTQPNVIHIQCNSRTLFSTIDILMRCFGLFELDIISINAVDPYQNCTLRLNGIPTTLTYQTWRHEEDNSVDSPLGHQITLTYPEGVLSLGGTFGPCLWFPLVAPGIPANLPLYQPITSEHVPPVNVSMVIHWRKQANQQALLELVSQSASPIFHHSPTYNVHLCDLWTELLKRLPTTSKPTEQLSSSRHFLSPENILNS